MNKIAIEEKRWRRRLSALANALDLLREIEKRCSCGSVAPSPHAPGCQVNKAVNEILAAMESK